MTCAPSDWWETQRPNYSVFVSELVISEASKGLSRSGTAPVSGYRWPAITPNFSRSSEFGAGTPVLSGMNMHVSLTTMRTLFLKTL